MKLKGFLLLAVLAACAAFAATIIAAPEAPLPVAPSSGTALTPSTASAGAVAWTATSAQASAAPSTSAVAMASGVTPAVVKPKPVGGKKGHSGPFGEFHSPNNTADHSRFEILQKPFASPMEVTMACISCHNDAAAQVQKTIHWKWLCPAAEPEARLGKAGNVVNNFCISIHSNEPRCTSCHAGYGFSDKNFDFNDQTRVDCLVCHEQTGTYKKFPTKAGFPTDVDTEFEGKPFKVPDYNRVAQSVGLPTRKNCGVCHFYGGGGEGVKHGDLDASLDTPGRDLDVHMNAGGANFTCIRCHTTVAHSIAGRCYKTSDFADRRSLLDDDRIKRITCVSCHSEKPHKTSAKMNDHTDKVACQSCHIPAFARKHSTKMRWDWSQAGRMGPDGKPLVKKEDGRSVYDGKKGAMIWRRDVVPEYIWYSGRLHYTMLTDKVDTSGGPYRINPADGSYGDKDARIYPFKVHTGRQPFDPVNKSFIVPHLFGKDDSAYWKTFNWDKAAKAGMAYAGLPFSGRIEFPETEYLYQTTHMVAPKEKALACTECHRTGGRLARLSGFYMPGRDRSRAVDIGGIVLALLCLGGTMIHGIIRIVKNKKG